MISAPVDTYGVYPESHQGGDKVNHYSPSVDWEYAQSVLRKSSSLRLYC